MILSGCSLLDAGAGAGGRGSSPDPETPVQDPVSERWYAPAEISQDPDGIAEHFPDLEVDTATWVDGQFTDPGERAPLPAPDDYWWQAVMEVGQETAAQLAADALAAVDESGAVDPEPLSGQESAMNAATGTRADDSVLQTVLIDQLDAEAGSCPDGWILVHDLIAAEDGGSLRATAEGMVISAAAVCEGEGLLVVDTQRF